MANPIFILDISPHGIVATHQAGFELPVFVAPTPEEKRTKHFNTIRPSLVTIGCFGLYDEGFAFDSSFIDPEARDEFTNFGELMFQLRALDNAQGGRFPPVSVFGHADPTGKQLYNKLLSGRRARAVHALLTRNTDVWEKLFSNREGVLGDEWGLKSIQHMLRTVGGAIPFYFGPVDGGATPETKKETREAIEAFQKSKNILPPTGIADGKDPKSIATRKALFADYMDAICKLKTGAPFKLQADRDFLCRDRDPAKRGKGDIQGCGEFNPLFLMSLQHEKELSKEERDEFYAQDRRVIVYIFKHGSELNPVRWPCPAAMDGPEGCKARFWSDGESRRLVQLPDQDRHFTETEDTFACRWYHSFAVNSPCENLLKLWVIRLRVDGVKAQPEPLANRAFVVTGGETDYAPVLRGFTNDQGEIRIPVFDETATMTLKVDFFGTLEPRPPNSLQQGPEGFDSDKFTGEDDFLAMKLDCGALQPPSGKIPARQRLYNLGLGTGKSSQWNDEEEKQAVSGFQRIYGSNHGITTVTGTMDAKTEKAIFDEHEKHPLED